MRICVITPQPTPYRDPFWNTVAQQPRVELDVFYCYAKGEDRPWEIDWPFRFRAEVLPGRAWFGQHNGYWNPSILQKLRATPYDAIILGGYNHLTMLAAAWYARRHRIPYYIMCESYLRQPRPWWAKVVKGPVLRRLFKAASGGLPTGTLAKSYLIHYGIAQHRICLVPNSPDIDSLMQASRSYHSMDKRELKRLLGLGPDPVILFVGRLLPLKNVDKLIAACELLARGLSPQLVIIGSGPDENRLQSIARKSSGKVRFVGFVSPRELPRWYSAADVFALPSYDETWGVVVLEALSCGCPVVVSDMVGSGPDVINRPEIGSIVPVNDVHSLAEALKRHILQRLPPQTLMELWQPVAQRMRHGTVAQRLVAFLTST